MSNNKTLAERIVDSAGTGKADPEALVLLSDITASASEINVLDGVTASTAELNILDGVTSTAAELNILDGVTATASEINKLDGVGAAVASGTQAAKINDPSGGATTDAEARTAINAIIDALEAFGISATS